MILAWLRFSYGGRFAAFRAIRASGRRRAAKPPLTCNKDTYATGVATLKAQNYNDAAVEAFELMFYRGMTKLDRLFGTDALGIIWYAGSTARDKLGLVSEGVCDPDLMNGACY